MSNDGFDKLNVKITDSTSSSDSPYIVVCKKSELKSAFEKLQCEHSVESLINGMMIQCNQKTVIFMEVKNDTNPYIMGSQIGAKLQSLEMDKVNCLMMLDDDAKMLAIEACMLRYPTFTQYKTKKVNTKTKEITFVVNDKAQAEKQMVTTNHIVRNVLYVRRLSNLPSNHKRPSDMSAEAYKLEDLGIKCKVLQGDDIKEMQCLTGVGQASTDKSKLIVLEWMPKPGSDVIALVGKGITFDSGGLSIKPARGMISMKHDMTGGATVMGIIRAAAQMQLQHNIVAVVPCAENMVSGDALRPGDILKSYSGQTVLVLDTDAEGRLVLADALTYVQTKYSPSVLMDFATLTGAVRVALGDVYTGVFANDDDMYHVVEDSGKKVMEKVWRLPLDAEYDKMLDSDIADMQNINDAVGAGSITAAHFLQRFINSGVKWMHFDIAATGYTESKPGLFNDKAATGVCVRLVLDALDELAHLG